MERLPDRLVGQWLTEATTLRHRGAEAQAVLYVVNHLGGDPTLANPAVDKAVATADPQFRHLAKEIP